MGVDAGRTPPTVGCRTRETEWGEEDAARPRVIRLREGESTPGELLWGKRRPAYDFIAGQRMGERRSLAQGEHRQWGSCET